MLENLSHFEGYVLWGEERKGGRGGDVHCINKRKRKKNNREYQALDQVYQVIDEALLGKGFQDTGYLGKKLTGNTKFRGKINGGEHV